MTPTQTEQNNRITIIDALRGFALLGVVLVHMQQHYSIFSFGGAEPSAPMFPEIDNIVRWFTNNVLMGKFINIFAFLFGMSFFIQMDRASKKGIDFRKRFIWRMVILFVIGIVGAAFYSGDILSFYAVFGLLLVFLYPLRNKMLMLIVCLLLLGSPRIISYGYDKYQESRQTAIEMTAPTPTQNWEWDPNFVPEPPSFTKSVKDNLTSGRESTFNYQFGFGGRGYITIALFILGFIVGRIRFFETIQQNVRRNVILFAVFSAGAWLCSFLSGLFPPQFGFFGMGAATPEMLARAALNDINSVLFSAAIVMAFVLLYSIRPVGKALDILAPYGRMGLTNYEMQGIIGSVLFSLWGFGSYFGPLHPTSLFCLGLVVYATQIILSKIWLNYFKYGPLEWIWRSATYLKWQPMLKA